MRKEKIVKKLLVVVFILLFSMNVFGQFDGGGDDYTSGDQSRYTGQTAQQKSGFRRFVVGLQFGVGFPTGDIFDIEKEAGESIGFTYSTPSGTTTKYGTIDHYDFIPAISIEYMVKKWLGIKISYAYHLLQQSLKVGGGEYELKTWNGTLLGYHAISLGASWHFVNTRSFDMALSANIGFLTGVQTFMPAGFDSASGTAPESDMTGISCSAGVSLVYKSSESIGWMLGASYTLNKFSSDSQLYADATGVKKDFDTTSVEVFFGCNFYL